jgi:hypothetical protein
MYTSSVKEMIIDLRLVDEGRDIGTISFIQGEKPKLHLTQPEDNEKYKAELQSLIEKLSTKKLPIQIESDRHPANGKIVIREKFKYCSLDDSDFAIALAHELTHHHIFGGCLIRGIARQY